MSDPMSGVLGCPISNCVGFVGGFDVLEEIGAMLLGLAVVVVETPS